jgi:hypothetical protein
MKIHLFYSKALLILCFFGVLISCNNSPKKIISNGDKIIEKAEKEPAKQYKIGDQDFPNDQVPPIGLYKYISSVNEAMNNISNEYAPDIKYINVKIDGGIVSFQTGKIKNGLVDNPVDWASKEGDISLKNMFCNHFKYNGNDTIEAMQGGASFTYSDYYVREKSNETIQTNAPFRRNNKGSHEVFVVGVDNCVATYWINDEPFKIGDGLTGTKIFVTDNDIYVTLKKCSYNHANWYWKNGQISNVDGDVNSIFVDGDDVYLAGEKEGKATYWKNGNAITIPSARKAQSIFVKNNDVYIALMNGSYWVNGTFFPLKNCDYAASIFVYENDVYVAGYGWDESGGDPHVAKYWKNGQEVNLSDGSKNVANANSIFVADGDVFVAGKLNSSAVYWKNGEVIPLTNGKYKSEAYSICVDGSDVYVAGYELGLNGEGGAKYWKNGEMHRLNNQTHDINSEAYSIIVR